MYLRSNGFPVNGVDVEDMAPVKQKYAVPADLQACHTGVVEGYVVEGHVPADLIDLDEEKVIVTRVSLSSPRNVTVGNPVALVYCRPQ